MATTAEDYIESKRKEVPLPSTLADGSHPVFIIKGPDTEVSIRVLDIIGVDVDKYENLEDIGKDIKLTRKESIDKTVKAIRLLFPACIVSPKVVLTEEELVDGAILLSDIPPTDGVKLYNSIMDLTEKSVDVKDIQKFREKSDM